MLEVRGVATFYGAIQALHGVDLDVAQGEIVALIGANGAGKSTLLMTICGNPRARSGEIRLEGAETMALSPDLAETASTFRVVERDDRR